MGQETSKREAAISGEKEIGGNFSCA